MLGVFPLVGTRREVWFSSPDRMMRMVGDFPLVRTMRVMGDFPLVSMMRVVGDFPLVKVEAVVLLRLVSVSRTTEYSPGKSYVCSIKTSLI